MASSRASILSQRVPKVGIVGDLGAQMGAFWGPFGAPGPRPPSPADTLLVVLGQHWPFKWRFSSCTQFEDHLRERFFDVWMRPPAAPAGGRNPRGGVPGGVPRGGPPPPPLAAPPESEGGGNRGESRRHSHSLLTPVGSADTHMTIWSYWAYGIWSYGHMGYGIAYGHVAYGIWHMGI